TIFENRLFQEQLTTSWAKDLQKILQEKKVYFFFSINAMGIDIKVGEKSLYDHLAVPLFAFMVDHPMYHIDRLNKGVANLIVSCVDKRHIAFLNKYMSGQYSKVFIPHGSSLVSEPTAESKRMKDRNIDIVFTSTYRDPDYYRQQWESQTPFISSLFDEIAERAMVCSDQSLMETAENVFVEKGIDLEYLHHRKFWLLLTQVDLYIRFQRKKEFVSFLSRLPVRIEIFGNGWESSRITTPHMKFNPPIGFIRAQEQMRNAKMVATVMPNFLEGGHERVFTSMLSGAISITNTNSFFTSNFEHQKSIWLYNFDYSGLEDELISVLSNHDRLQSIADEGRRLAQENHTWLTRANKIVEAVHCHKFFLS
ncbi:glycosyltransferase, partial [Paenibacillus thermoaerophilus]